MNDFKEFEKQAWEAKAARYDHTWGNVSNQIVTPLLDKLEPVEGLKLLDCGCGPGHLCGEAMARGAIVTGCDYSEQMVTIAKENYARGKFESQDAENLTYEDGSFDIVTMNYLLLHVADQRKTLLGGKRVLKKGGRLVFSIWLSPSESPGLALMFQPVKDFADLSVIPPAEDIFTFSNAEYCQEFLSGNGFADIECERVETYWDIKQPEDFFNGVQAGTRIGGTIDLQKSEIKEQIKNSIMTEIEQFKVGARYLIPTPSLLVIANKN